MRSSSLSDRWLSSLLPFARANQSPTTLAMQRSSIAASNTPESVCNVGGCDYFESIAFEGDRHHVANSVIIVHEQDFMHDRSLGRNPVWKWNNGTFGRSHGRYPQLRFLTV